MAAEEQRATKIRAQVTSFKLYEAVTISENLQEQDSTL